MNKRQQRRSEKGTKRADRAEIILHLFRDFPNTQFTLKYLASVSGGASKEGRRETFEILSQLFDEGIVEECSREKYRLSQQHRPLYEGVASMTQSGAVYVSAEGLDSDIFVQARNAYNALDGDRVEVAVIHRGRDGRFEGEITRIIERSRKPYVGVAEVGAHQIFVRADSRRMPMDIYLSRRTWPDVRDGEKVVVRIVDWLPGSKSPVGELVERLGMAGNNDTEMHAILAEYDLPYRFEPEVEEAAAAIDGRVTAREIAQRRDFRKVTTFTVDPADAKDFDDALSIRRIKDGVWEINEGGLTLEVGTNISYAAYVNDGHWTAEKGSKGRWVPGRWEGDRFVYDPSAETGMYLKQKWVPGKHYWESALRILNEMYPRLLETKLQDWLTNYFGA